ncbi:MAG: class III extradiol ring-cleavage dioxygenase [Pseudomonadota bacterium]
MAARMPVVFVSHGAPDALLKAPDAVACWREIGRQAPAPAAVLAVSAHWEARSPTLDLSGAPETLHDFSGFAPSLHRMQYPAPGAPALAGRAASLINAAGMGAELHPGRGLDHGAWVPLSAMYPQANVPVVQLSLMRSAGPAGHLALGRALARLREEGVLILASGAITHNFDWLDWRGEAEPLPQARAFSEWVAARLAENDELALLDYRVAEHGAKAHPSEEHFLPLFVALGAAGNDEPTRRQPRYRYGSLSMDAYVWR